MFSKKNLREEQKERTAAAVLEAARDEFERVGFEKANLRAIAKAAGVSAGTVLHHHGDKLQLLHAALFDELDRTLQAALAKPGKGPLQAQLRRLARAVFGSYTARPRLARVLLKESLFAEPPWSPRFIAQATEVQVAVTRLHAQAVERRELGPGDDLLAAVAWLSFFYFTLISWAQGAVKDPVALVDALTAQHLAARLPRRSTS